MRRSRVIAHRGFWLRPDEKNTPTAFARALSEGFGIETDFRDLGGDLVISHHPPQVGALLAKEFFTQCAAVREAGLLARPAALISCVSAGHPTLPIKSPQRGSTRSKDASSGFSPSLGRYQRNVDLLRARRIRGRLRSRHSRSRHHCLASWAARYGLGMLYPMQGDERESRLDSDMTMRAELPVQRIGRQLTLREAGVRNPE